MENVGAPDHLARVVADKFHITRMADLAVDGVRKEVRGGIDSKRMQLRLKKDKFVLKTRADNLSDWQRDRLTGWRADFPDIGIAYDLKEEFYRIYDAASRQEAKLRLDTWRANIPGAMWKHWEPILTTFGNWENEIFAFFRRSAAGRQGADQCLHRMPGSPCTE